MRTVTSIRVASARWCWHRNSSVPLARGGRCHGRRRDPRARSPPRDARSAALHRIRKLDVDAKVVGIQLELVAFEHPPFSSASMVSGRVVVVVEGKLPVPVTLW